MAQAFAVIAAGGYLSQPHFVTACINDEGQIIERHTSRPIKILDDDIVATLDSFMRGVVERGTGEPIGDAPFAIAGKTGTAEKPNLESGGYYKNRFMASFAGYFPADSPQVAGIVILDEPEPIHYGGYTAGPAFKNIAVKFAAIDKYKAKVSSPELGEDAQVYPDAGKDNRDLATVPDIIGASRGKAEFKLKKAGLTLEFSGRGQEVIGTRPAANSRLLLGQTVYCYMSQVDGKKMEMPDLVGLTIREAVNILDQYGIDFTCHGRGRVVRQNPSAGTALTAERTIDLECNRHKGV
jgi:stage V sporulation protein D (sporulation-specific penicillin-binding protein)